MAKRDSKLRDFTIQMAVSVWLDVPVKAESHEAALTHAKSLKVDDLVDIHGTANDSNVSVAGVFDNAVLTRHGF